MSIIQDALRKAQARYRKEYEPDKTGAAQEAVSVKVEPREAGAVKSENTNNIPFRVIVMASAALLILALSGGIYFSRAGHPVKKDDIPSGITSDDTRLHANASIPDIAPIPESPFPDKAPALSGKDTARFLLNGIMYLEEGPQAIINGAVVKEGDVVNGAAVMKINRNNVLMKFKDAEIVLRLT